MTDETNVNAGSETPGEPTETTTVATTETTTETVKTDAAEVNAGGAVEQTAGDACTCPDGREGTLHDQEGTLVCIPNQG